jgi:hypothetical protein
VRHRCRVVGALGLASLAVAAALWIGASRGGEVAVRQVHPARGAAPPAPSRAGERVVTGQGASRTRLPAAARRGPSRRAAAPAASRPGAAPAAPPTELPAEPDEVAEAPDLDRGDRALALDPADASRAELRVTGSDALAPRPLVLWRVDAPSGRSVAVAAGASDVRGRIHFEAFPRPPGALALVAAPLGVRPGGAGASMPVALPPLPPPAPWVRVEARKGSWAVDAQVGPGAVLLLDHPQSGRIEIPASGRSRRVQVRVDPPREGRSLLAAQRLAAGARSAWRPVAPLAPPDPSAALDEGVEP